MQMEIIAAVARNGAIGYRNKLLYHIAEDMARFRQLTLGHTVLMGRKTFESLPGGPLPGRRNIVLSRHMGERSGAEVVRSWAEAMACCGTGEVVFVIGGAQVYRAAMPWACRMWLTEVDHIPPRADAFFPSFARSDWRLVSKERHPAGAGRRWAFTFADYESVRR